MGTDDRFKREKDKKKKREEAERDIRNRTWLIVCEGSKTEPNYFKGLVEFLNKNGSKTVLIRPEGKGRNTENLVTSISEYFNFVGKCYGRMNIKYPNIIFVFDKDDFKDNQFNNAVKKAKKYEQRGVNEVIVAWSNESFELWLCLHYNLIQAALTRAQYNDILTCIFKKYDILTENQNYDKHGKNLKTIFNEIVKNEGSFIDAIRNSKKLLSEVGSGKTPSKSNPCTMVYKAVEALARDAGYEIS